MRLLITALTALMLFATPVMAGDREDAAAAFKAEISRLPYSFLKPRAEQGDAKAQYNLGVAYSRGDSIPKDNAKAVYWYRKAAEQFPAIATTVAGEERAEPWKMTVAIFLGCDEYQKKAKDNREFPVVILHGA